MKCSGVDYSNSVVVVTLEVLFPDVAEFLESVDLLGCMYVSKAVCSAAGKRLNVISVSAHYQTGTQQSMLEGWLEHPDFPFGALIEEAFVLKEGEGKKHAHRLVCVQRRVGSASSPPSADPTAQAQQNSTNTWLEQRRTARAPLVLQLTLPLTS